MKNYVILVIILWTCFVVIAAWECPVPNQLPVEHEPKLYKGLRKFTFDFLRQKIKINPNRSLLFSPMSAYRILTIGYVGTHGKTSKLFANKLNLDWNKDKEEVVSEYLHEKNLWKKIAESETQVIFERQDVAFFDKEFPIVSCIKDLFPDEIKLLQLKNNPEKGRQNINSWIANNTRMHIKNLLPKGAVHNATDIVMANAVYFKAPWQFEFNPDETIKKKFFKTPNQTVQVDMMKKSGEMTYGINSQLNFIMVELPYKPSDENSKDVTFKLFLPLEKKNNGVDEIINAFNRDTMKFTKLKHGPVELELPKFIIQDTTDIVEILKLLEWGPLFDESADFSGISGTYKYMLESFYHKAKIQVDETGTEASVATASRFSDTAEEPPVVVQANHPFFFIIYDDRIQTMSFAGVYRGP